MDLIQCKNCGQTAQFSNLESGTTASSAPMTRVCNTCGCWVVDVKSALELEKIYSKDYFSGGEYLNYAASKISQIRNFKRKLDILKAHMDLNPDKDSVLEIGCATGDFLEILRERGFKKLLGVEVAPYARQIALDKKLSVLSPFDEKFVDSIRLARPTKIFAWDVWEHLEDPVQMFDNLLKQADSKVEIAFTTVDAGGFVPQKRKTKWRQFHPPSHLNYPTQQSLRMYLESRGFDVVYQKSFGMYRPLIEYLGAALKFWKGPISKLPSAFHVPIYLNLYDLQFVIARKRRVDS